LCLAVGCTRQPPAELDRPEARHIYSRVSRGQEGEILLAATLWGGGAGDITYRAFACPTGEPRCEVLSAISAADAEKIPKLIHEGDRIFLVVDEGDRIGEFRSYSTTLPSLKFGGLYLRYRQHREQRPE
jgi:hypothetical protein